MKLIDYIRGLREGKEAHRLEKEAMQDPFLADAMDGYTTINGNQEKQIKRLGKRIRTRSVQRRRRTLGWSIAAGLLIGGGVGLYFLFLKPTLIPVENVRLAKQEIVFPASPASVEHEGNTGKELQAVQSDSTPKMRNLVTENRSKSVVASALPIAELEIREDIDEIIEEGITEEPVPVGNEAGATVLSMAKDTLPKVVANKYMSSLRNSVYGKVTDGKGEPLVGASVTLKGTKLGTVTDMRGNFTLKADGHKELSVAYIGYEPVELPADTTKNLLIAMNEDNQALEEAPVLGLGTRIRNRVLGAVASLKMSGKPQPVIGRREFRKYLKENLVQPTDKECAKIKGKVILAFLVDKEGRPQDIVVKKGLCTSADREAIRLIEEGPDWTVGDDLVEVRIRF